MSPAERFEMPADAEPRYIPAARWRIFTRLYDPALALAMRERRFRDLMRRRVNADLPSGGTAVDVGCGTGTFAIALASQRADAKVVGVDGDPEILALAQGKPGADAVAWDEGLAQELPPADRSADVVTMSLVLHHLLPEDKRKALAEAKRIIKPGGSLHIADWGRPRDPLVSALFFVAQAIDGFDRTRDHRAGRLPQFIAEAGFGSAERYGCFRTAAGSLDLLTARVESA
jgi:ubiquinone/menaquinone biosynthesis C-methylase UbiE